MFTNYVAGFMFRREGSQVALVLKNKPDWQKGKLNGIGGKQEAGEEPHEAMAREFWEETGVKTSPAEWSTLATLELADACIRFFVYRHPGDLYTLRQTTDEYVDWYKVSGVLTRWATIPNLKWLIPLALDPHRPHVRLNDE